MVEAIKDGLNARNSEQKAKKDEAPKAKAKAK